MEQVSDEISALQRAIDKAGSQKALGRLIGTTQQNVSTWHKATRGVPAEYVIPIEKHTGVSRHDLRPDIYPVETVVAEQQAA